MFSSALGTGEMADSLKEFFAYWGHLRGEKDMLVPFHFTFDLGRLGAILPRMCLMKRLTPDDITVGLAGSAMDQGFAQPLTGMNVFDLTAAGERPLARRFYNALLDWPCGAHFLETRRIMRSGGTMAIATSEVMLLPLADRKGMPAYLIGSARISGEVGPLRLTDHIFHDDAERRHIRFLDIGRGTPPIHMEIPPKTPFAAERAARRWWERFLPQGLRPTAWAKAPKPAHQDSCVETSVEGLANERTAQGPAITSGDHITERGDTQAVPLSKGTGAKTRIV